MFAQKMYEDCKWPNAGNPLQLPAILNWTPQLSWFYQEVMFQKTKQASASLLTINLMLAEALYKLSYKISIEPLTGSQ